MENAKYIFTNDKNVMGSRKKQDPVVPIDDIKIKNTDGVAQNTMEDRANYLTIGEQTISEDIIKLAKRRLFARKKILRDKYYKFIMQVAGFSNEPMIKLWKNETKKGEAPLTASDHSLAWETDWNPKSFKDILAEIQAGDKKENLKNELESTLQMKLKADFLNSAEITGQIFMTPNAYSHLLEAWEIIRHRCNVDIELEKLVDIEHSTYFARLVALRIQISRFLSGRYYTVSSNYKRLIRQQELLISGYFKSKFNANQCQPNQNPYLQQLQNQC